MIPTSWSADRIQRRFCAPQRQPRTQTKATAVWILERVLLVSMEGACSVCKLPSPLGGGVTDYLIAGFETGKTWCHNLALQLALLHHNYTYVWLMMNDLVLHHAIGDPLQELLAQMASQPRMGLLSPTNSGVGSEMPGARPRFYPTQSRPRWRKVAVVDYLGFLMRTEAIRDAGFLNPVFRWCWGAEYELAYRLYSKGWFVAYSDTVRWRHLGGTTQGVKSVKSGVASRAQYQRRAALFAHVYLRRKYGWGWHDLFWEAARSHSEEFVPRLNSYLQWTSSHQEMFNVLSEGPFIRALGQATGKMIAMLVTVEDNNSTIHARASWLCHSVLSTGMAKAPTLEVTTCVAEMARTMLRARENITERIGPYLQAAAAEI